MNVIKRKVITYSYSLVLALIIFLLYFMFIPRSMDSAKQRAINEFSFFCTDNRIDRSLFVGPKLVFENEKIRIFQWSAKHAGNDATIHVRVPNRRIGEYTLGIIGQDISIGDHSGDSSKFFDTK